MAADSQVKSSFRGLLKSREAIKAVSGGVVLFFGRGLPPGPRVVDLLSGLLASLEGLPS